MACPASFLFKNIDRGGLGGWVGGGGDTCGGWLAHRAYQKPCCPRFQNIGSCVSSDRNKMGRGVVVWWMVCPTDECQLSPTHTRLCD